MPAIITDNISVMLGSVSMVTYGSQSNAAFFDDTFAWY
jgi:hypothetical protein